MLKKNITLKAVKYVTVSLFAMICCTALTVCAFAVKTTCTVYNGSNTYSNNYSFYWGTPTESYLRNRTNGYMRVQNLGESGVLVEYYDKSFNLTGTKKIKQELPIFGAFYETSANYYIVSGQENLKQSNTVECYRITKYDKNWKRLSSVGLSNCNTYIPFDGGTCRIAQVGKYLILHTCHEMYATSDGLHHQANVTIQVDTSAMKITDAFYDIMDVNVGYVSHSFNQFIAADGNKIVTLDHGDAYPRSLALIKYRADVSKGKFQADYFDSPCKYYSMLDIPGATGDNYTGVTVGGFEVSSKAYITVGTKINFNDSNSVSNIFVSTLKKNGTTATVKMITSEKSTDIGTPHLVKVATDKYILLWTKDTKVYYTFLDAYGNKTGKIYSMTGEISDCVPIVSSGKLVWYTWNNEKVNFYEINITRPASNKKTAIVNGHKYKWNGTTNGTAKLKCTVCGKTTTKKVATRFDVYWERSNGLYYKALTTHTYYAGSTINFFYGMDIDSEVVAKSSDPAIVSVSDNTLKMKKAGSATVTFYPRYNPTLKQVFKFTVKNKFAVTDLSVKSKTSSSVTLKWSSSDEAAGYIIEKYNGKKWVRAAKVTGKSNTSCTIKGLQPDTAYKFRIKAYKKSGRTYAYSGYSPTLTAKTKIAVSAVSGVKSKSATTTSITLGWNKNSNATGYVIQQYKNNKWVQVAKTKKNTTVSFTVKSLSTATTYKFRIKAYKGTLSSKWTYINATTNPYAVKNLKARAKTASTVTLTWDKHRTAQGYIVEQYKNNKWVRVTKITNKATASYKVTGLSPSTVYKFRVKAYRIADKQARYGTVSATCTVRTNPTGVSGFKASKRTKNSITLEWSKNSKVTGYVLQYYNASAKKWTDMKRIGSNITLSCKVNGLTSGKSYAFRIRTYKTIGKNTQYSAWSNCKVSTMR